MCDLKDISTCLLAAFLPVGKPEDLLDETMAVDRLLNEPRDTLPKGGNIHDALTHLEAVTSPEIEDDRPEEMEKVLAAIVERMK